MNVFDLVTELRSMFEMNATNENKCMSVEIYSTVFMCSKDNIYVLSDCLNIHIRFKMEIQLHE